MPELRAHDIALMHYPLDSWTLALTSLGGAICYFVFRILLLLVQSIRYNVRSSETPNSKRNKNNTNNNGGYAPPPWPPDHPLPLLFTRSNPHASGSPHRNCTPAPRPTAPPAQPAHPTSSSKPKRAGARVIEGHVPLHGVVAGDADGAAAPCVAQRGHHHLPRTWPCERDATERSER